MSERMTDEMIEDLATALNHGAAIDAGEILDALVAEREEVERLNAELATLRARCTRQDGDPAAEMLVRWAENDMVPLYVRDIARALLRAWGEET